MEVKKFCEKTWTLTCYIAAHSLDGGEYGKRPAVLVIPGGGYHMCSKREGEPVALEYLAQGFQAYVLEYSVGSENSFSRALQDAQEAFDYICRHCDELHTDPAKIAVCGFSAGGHLAAALSTLSPHKPCAAVLGYPCILKEISRILAFEVPSLDEAVTSETPPTFIAATANDACVPIENSLAYAAALNRSHVPFEMHIFSDGPHGFSVAKPHTAGGDKAQYSLKLAQWVPLSVDFLNAVFDVGVGGLKKF